MTPLQMVKYIAPSFDWQFASDPVNVGYDAMTGFTFESKITTKAEEEREEEELDISSLPQHILFAVVDKMPNITRTQLRMTNRSFFNLLNSKDAYFSKRTALGSDVSFFVELQSPNTITMTTSEMGALCYTTENHVETLRGFSVNKLTIDVYEECFEDDTTFEDLLNIFRAAKLCCNQFILTGIPANFAVQMIDWVNCFGEIRFAGRFCNTGTYIETMMKHERRASFFADLEETHSYLYEPRLNRFWNVAGFTEKVVFRTDLLMQFITELCHAKNQILLKKAEIQILDPSVPPFDPSLETPMFTVLWNKASLSTPRNTYVPDIIRKISTSSKWIIISQICSIAFDRKKRLVSTKYDITISIIEKDIQKLLKVLKIENLNTEFDNRTLDLFENGDDEDRFNILREAFNIELSQN